MYVRVVILTVLILDVIGHIGTLGHKIFLYKVVHQSNVSFCHSLTFSFEFELDCYRYTLHMIIPHSANNPHKIRNNKIGVMNLCIQFGRIRQVFQIKSP